MDVCAPHACMRVCACLCAGATTEEIEKHWKWLDQNLLPYMSVFENKQDAASFAQGKVKVLSHLHSDPCVTFTTPHTHTHIY